jgi:DNA-binding FrmR family transcriptional regulator
MAGHTQTRAVAARLARIAGHVQAVKRMVEDGRSCSDVLVQLGAVRAAVDRVAKLVLGDHLEHCILDTSCGGDPKKHLVELRQALDRLLR